MEIIKTTAMPDGTHIQLEDWRKDYPTTEKNYTIGAYPICQKVRSGEKFRLTISRFNADDDVKQIFEDLTSGKITLADLRNHFWYTYKDEYRLGLISYAEYSKHEY